MQKGTKMDNYTKPNSPVEHKIVLLLGLCGIKKDTIDFLFTDKGERILQIGHWVPLKNRDMAYIKEHLDTSLNEISWYDADCGWQCYYRVDS